MTLSARKRRANPFVRAVLRTRPDGDAIHAWPDIEHAMPYVALLTLRATPPGEAPEVMRKTLGTFFAKLGIARQTDEDTAAGIIERYYADNPINPRLFRDLKRILRDVARYENPSVLMDAVVEFLSLSPP